MAFYLHWWSDSWGPLYQYLRGEIVAQSQEILSASDLKVAETLIALGWDIFEKNEPSGFDPCFSNDWDRFEAESIKVQTDFTQFSRLMRAPSPAGNRNAAIRKTIWRLATTQISVTNRQSDPGRAFTLLRIGRNPEATTTIDVELHPLTLTALAVDSKMALTLLREASQLPSEMSRLIHCRLSGCVSPGLMRSITMDELCHDLAPKHEVSVAYQSNLRYIIRKGVHGLTQAGWQVLTVGSNRFLVVRPRIS